MPDIKMVADIPCIVPPVHCPVEKNPGLARFVFVGRICKMKNLAFALRAMIGTKGALLDIYGPKEDPRCWRECEEIIHINQLPAMYWGELEYDRVIPILQKYHFFILPTLGENFCHAIFESLAAGCTPLISNKTSWHDLMEKEAGWTLPLEHIAMWKRVISRCVDMDQESYAECSNGSHKYAAEWFQRQGFSEQYAEMFTLQGS